MEIFDGISLNDVVTFDLYTGARVVIPTSFTSCEIVSVLDYDTASLYIEPDKLHVNIYPSLPSGSTPDDYTAYNYLKLKLQDGTYTAIGIPWIDSSTVEKITAGVVQLTVEPVNPADHSRITEILSAAGFSVLKIETV